MTRSGGWRLATWVAMAAVLAAACGDDASPASSTTSGGGGTGGGATVLPFAESPCGTCLQTECASLVEACTTEPECALYLECVGACPTLPDGGPDPACQSACTTPSGAAAAEAHKNWSTCADGSAGCVACGHTPSQPNPFADQVCPDSGDPDLCTACWEENCCGTGDQCFASNDDCADLYSCTLSCPPGAGDEACYQGCFARYPQGVQDFITDFACTAVECIPCDGSDNPCVDCVQDKCGGAIAACLTSEPCFLAAACFADCPDVDPSCVDGCLAPLDPAQLAVYEAWRLCAIQECSVECD